MKTRSLFFPLLALGLFFTACEKEAAQVEPVPEPMKAYQGKSAHFTVRIENLGEAYPFFASGMFNTPEGAATPGPATPGHAFEFMFHAGPGHRLSLASMFGQSNDIFIAPADEGIPLYNAGEALTGDITQLFYLWDAGTEVNEAPGVGPNQAPRQSGPDTGESEHNPVRMIANVSDGFSYPAVEEILRATLSHDGGTQFTLRLEVQPGSITPISPGVWVVHDDGMPLFTEGEQDYGLGLEGIAEDANPMALASYLEENSGLVTLFSPGAWAVHKNKVMLFTEGQPDYGWGLEAIAEDGDPGPLATALKGLAGVYHSAAFTTPLGAAGPMPAGPDAACEFSFTATPAQQYLSFVTMYVQSNDLFLAPDEEGIHLWEKGRPISGDVSHQFYLWDAGTEVNQYPGAGSYQAPRQPAPDTGPAEGGTVRRISEVNDGFTYPNARQLIRVTITSSLQ